MSTQTFEFGLDYVTEHFGTNVPLATQQATHNLFRECPERLVDHIIRCLALNGREAILDIGCGNGIILRDIVSRLRDGGRAVALDISPVMLELARKNTGTAWVPLEFYEGKAEYLSKYCTGQFDRVMANFIFHYIEQPRLVCAEMVRVLAEGGKAIVSIEARGSMHEMYGLHFEAMERVGFPASFIERLPRGRRGTMVLDNTAAVLGDYFRQVEEHPYVDSLRFERPEPFMRFYVTGHGFCGAKAMAGNDIPEELFESLSAEVEQMVRQRIADAGYFRLGKRNSVFVCSVED